VGRTGDRWRRRTGAWEEMQLVRRLASGCGSSLRPAHKDRTCGEVSWHRWAAVARAEDHDGGLPEMEMGQRG
jgi:hypothetical protein